MSQQQTNWGDPRELHLHRMPQRDVPYVPTDEPVVAAMLRFGHVTADDVVYDLGCGDGRIVIAAARHYGARGVGVDIDPVRIQESRERARKEGVGNRVSFLCRSFFEVDLSEATVVMLYLLPAINVKLRPKLMGELRPGTRIVANQFDMGDWPMDMRADVHHRTLRQWVVPAWVGGTWSCVINDPRQRWKMMLKLKRQYQTVLGTAVIGRKEVDVYNGKLFGAELSFKVPHPENPKRMVRFGGQVEGQYMRGTCRYEWDGEGMAWGAEWRSG